MNIIWNNEDYLMHYGMPRRSGRYKWGSGEDPYHHGADSPRKQYKRNLKAAKANYKSRLKTDLKPGMSTKELGSTADKLYNDWKNEKKQIKQAYKQTTSYKSARKKKILGAALGASAITAGVYLHKNPDAMAKVKKVLSNIKDKEIKDIKDVKDIRIGQNLYSWNDLLKTGRDISNELEQARGRDLPDYSSPKLKDPRFQARMKNRDLATIRRDAERWPRGTHPDGLIRDGASKIKRLNNNGSPQPLEKKTKRVKRMVIMNSTGTRPIKLHANKRNGRYKGRSSVSRLR